MPNLSDAVTLTDVEAELTRALVTPDGVWSRVRVVARTDSTNADLAAIARLGTPEGLVLLAESQEAGRGRMGRSWQTPPGTAVTMSVLLRPQRVAGSNLGWLPLLAGVAVVSACAGVAGVDAALKWPNDLLLRPAGGLAQGRGPEGWGKGGGILAEATGDAAVVGIGVNVSQDSTQLPPPSDPLAYPPVSLASVGARYERQQLAIDILRNLAQWYRRWSAAGGDPSVSGLRDAYLSHCTTVGRAVTATLPSGGSLRGTATQIDTDGRLVVATPTGEHRLAAGDVHHVRMDTAVPGDDPPFQGRVPVAPAH